jgi:hypothetical protein
LGWGCGFVTQRHIDKVRQLNPTIQNSRVPALPKNEEGRSAEEKRA